jgi:hypothetical protein
MRRYHGHENDDRRAENENVGADQFNQFEKSIRIRMINKQDGFTVRLDTAYNQQQDGTADQTQMSSQ